MIADGNNVRATGAVSLGVIYTPGHDWLSCAERGGLRPLGRVGEVADIVEWVLLLEQASFVTGTRPPHSHLRWRYHAELQRRRIMSVEPTAPTGARSEEHTSELQSP